MKVYTVVHQYENETWPFVYSYRTKRGAVQAIEDAAQDNFNSLIDPNDGETHVFPGLDWNDDMSIAYIDRNEPDAGQYIITETELKG